LDNLAPGVPTDFVYNAGLLAWNASSANDFDHFTVYGANTGSFGDATVVNYSVDPVLDVTASPYEFYFVTATDGSGNEGKPAKVTAQLGVGGEPRSYVLSVSNYPNPFNPRTTVSYTVPSRGRVTVSIYDTRGALVATLFDGERAAGAYSVDWDGRTDDAAGAASGIYFARIEHASGTRSKKMVLLK
jgi:FlgD Ig-like domain